MNPVSMDIKDMLVTEGLGVFMANTGWSINIAVEPEEPDTAITIYDTGGVPDYTLINSANPVDHDTFQVRVRAISYIEGHAKALEINKFLDKTDTYIETGGTYDVTYYTFQRSSGIISLGENDNDEYIWITNFRTTRHESDI